MNPQDILKLLEGDSPAKNIDEYVENLRDSEP